MADFLRLVSYSKIAFFVAFGITGKMLFFAANPIRNIMHMVEFCGILVSCLSWHRRVTSKQEPNGRVMIATVASVRQFRRLDELHRHLLDQHDLLGGHVLLLQRPFQVTHEIDRFRVLERVDNQMDMLVHD
jgi:hypothetical protein